MEHNKPLKFIFFPPSPWSERARWALDYSGITYDKIIFTPLISTARARYLSQNFTHKLTVPIAIDVSMNNDKVMRDSLDIALHANSKRLDHCLNLFPAKHLNEIKEWNQFSERLLDILRVRANPRMMASRELQLNNLPPVLPNVIKPLFLPLSRYALHYFNKKYPLQPGNHKLTLTNGLKKIRATLEKSGGEYIFEQFSYADITTAAIFQAISPVENRFVKLDNATRKCWKDQELSDEFGDLIEWRDKLYQKHRIKT